MTATVPADQASQVEYGPMAPKSALSRVLIVDDDPQERRDLARIVTSLGYVPEVAGDGEEALEKLGANPVDAIVTDLMMPRMDGYTLLKTLLGRGDLTPAVVLTGLGSIREALAIIHDLRAFWFLEKPAQQAILAPLLERAIRQKTLIAETERLQRQLSSARSAGGYGGDIGTDAPRFFADPAGGSEDGFGADQRRKRDRQGTGGGGDSQAEPAGERTVRRDQLRGDAGKPDRERVVRPRKGRVHGRDRTPGRAVSSMPSGGTLFLDEIGGNADADAGQAAARFGRFEGTPVGRAGRDFGRRAGACGYQSPSGRGSGEEATARGSVLPPERLQHSSAAAAPPERRHPGDFGGADPHSEPSATIAA